MPKFIRKTEYEQSDLRPAPIYGLSVCPYCRERLRGFPTQNPHASLGRTCGYIDCRSADKQRRANLEPYTPLFRDGYTPERPTLQAEKVWYYEPTEEEEWI